MSVRMLAKGTKVFGGALLLLGAATAWHTGRAGAQVSDPECVPAALDASGPETQAEPLDGERHVVLLGTNDIHGAVEPLVTRDGKAQGGMPFWAGAISAIRRGVARADGERGGVLVVDAGDQFQGTLISNFSEGQLMFDLMSIAGYDAVTPGNHDYDFGPEGWLVDRVGPGTQQDPRGALKKILRSAGFPLVSANTYCRSSLKDSSGAPVPVVSKGCAPRDGAGAIRWAGAERPAFLKPYVIKKAGGVRVALIGIDNADTAAVTTPENVSDYCFRDPLATYDEVRDALEGKADVFVMVVHDGAKELEPVVERILALGKDRLHAVVAGHTHRRELKILQGVPMMQSGANGEAFGRIDLYYDPATRSVRTDRLRARSGINELHAECAAGSESFCAVAGEGSPADPRVVFDGERVALSGPAVERIAAARAEIAPVTGRNVGRADAPVTRERILESPLANAITDGIRQVSGADVVFVNTGGIRADLPAGELTYEQLFRVLPFSNHALVVGPVSRKTLLGLLQRSIESCGKYGSLMQSGLKVVFERACAGGADLDPKARLVSVRTLAGEEISLDPQAPEREFQVATLDFLLSGGDGFDFGKPPVLKDLGIIREVLVEGYFKPGYVFPTRVDGRWVERPRSGGSATER